MADISHSTLLDEMQGFSENEMLDVVESLNSVIKNKDYRLIGLPFFNRSMKMSSENFLNKFNLHHLPGLIL